MDIKFLNALSVVASVVLAATVAVIFLCPNSVVVGVLDRFQTLFTGILAGIIALATGGFVYRAAKLRVEAERDRQIERKRAMKMAGAAQLLSAVEGIFLAVIAEASKPHAERLGRVMVPLLLPSLETISTQDSEVIIELSNFLACANRFDSHTALNTWPHDEHKTDPDEKTAVDDLIANSERLKTTLANIAAGGQR
jgi:hypothetical protein